MSHDFNINDRVRIVSIGDYGLAAQDDPDGAVKRGLVVGNYGTVVATFPAGVLVKIDGDNSGETEKTAALLGTPPGWAFYPEELVKES